MPPSMPPYGSTNPYATHTPSTTPHDPAHPDAGQHQLPSRPRTGHTGRLANRFQSKTTNQQPPTYAATPAYPTPPNVGTHAAPHLPPQAAGQFPSMSSLSDALPQHAHQQQNTQTSPPSRPEYLVIGLFALRITKRLVQQLDPYDGHGADLNWLKRFLQPYRAEHALAKLTDARAIDDYVRNYPAMVRRMIKQPRYRRVFMDMNPDKKITDRELSDSKSIPLLRLGLVKKGS